MGAVSARLFQRHALAKLLPDEPGEHCQIGAAGVTKLRLVLPGFEQLDAEGIVIRLVGYAIIYIGGHLVEVALKLVLQHPALTKAGIGQEDAEVELVHPVAQGVEAHIEVVLIHIGLGTEDLTPRADGPTVPNRLAEREFRLVLVLAQRGYLHAREAKGIQVDGDTGHVALIRGLRRESQLGQVATRGVLQVVLPRLLYQAVLPDEGVVGPRQSVALLQGELRPGGKPCAEEEKEGKEGLGSHCLSDLKRDCHRCSTALSMQG